MRTVFMRHFHKRKCFRINGNSRGIPSAILFYIIVLSILINSSASFSVLNAEKESLTAFPSVPSASCARGEQCIPARVQTPFSARASESFSESMSSQQKSRVAPSLSQGMNSLMLLISESCEDSLSKRSFSCFLMFSVPHFFTNRTPAQSPAMFGTASVPASNDSGGVVPIPFLAEFSPFPPKIKGEKCEKSKSSEKRQNPLPCGP